MDDKQAAVPILPCEDLDVAQAFYARLGLGPTAVFPHHGYRILHAAEGASVHLTHVEPGWVNPERNAHGLYFYARDVVVLAAELGVAAEVKPWGMIEFAVSDPNGTLVRVGWPTGDAG